MVPLSRCRFVKYDEYTECLDQSFDDTELKVHAMYLPGLLTLVIFMFQSPCIFQRETFGQMVGGPKNYYSFELFLEIRAEDEVFKQYNTGGTST